MTVPIRILQDHHISGDFGDAFSTADIYRFGLYLGRRLKALGTPRIVVATDARESDRTHVHPLIGGLQGGDCDVTALGTAPYPMLAYAIRSLDSPHAAMMTAGDDDSPDAIGFRVVIDRVPMASYALKDLFSQSHEAAFNDASGTGRLQETDLSAGYLRWLLHGSRIHGNISVLWDPGNGSASEIVRSLAGLLTGRHVVINGGDGPVLARDESATGLALGNAVVAGGFDLGVALSGDGSRLVMTDNLGRPLSERHRLFILSTRRERQPVAGNGLLAQRRKAKTDAIKQALKVIQVVAGLPMNASDLRDRTQGAEDLGKGSTLPPGG